MGGSDADGQRRNVAVRCEHPSSHEYVSVFVFVVAVIGYKLFGSGLLVYRRSWTLTNAPSTLARGFLSVALLGRQAHIIMKAFLTVAHPPSFVATMIQQPLTPHRCAVVSRCIILIGQIPGCSFPSFEHFQTHLNATPTPWFESLFPCSPRRWRPI